MPRSPVEVRAMFTSHCLNCHSTEKQKGDLDLETSDITKEPQVWGHVIDQILHGEMPPKKEKKQPSDEQRTTNQVGAGPARRTRPRQRR